MKPKQKNQFGGQWPPNSNKLKINQ